MRYLAILKTLLFSLLLTDTMQAQEEPSKTRLNINNLALWVQPDGLIGYDNTDRHDAVTFPAGRVPVVWGRLVRDGQEPEIRVGGNTYSSGINAGIIQLDGTAGAATRIWRIRKNFAVADLQRDAALFFDKPAEEISANEIDEIRNQYKTDWQQWPVDLGVPFYDTDGDGLYTPMALPRSR